MRHVETAGGLCFAIAAEVDAIIKAFLRERPMEGDGVPCLVAAGPNNEGFIIGSHSRSELLTVPGVDEFVFGSVAIYVVLSPPKALELSGATLVAGKEFFEAVH